jgi:uncharacterized damage-inducible protein DinB
MIDGSPRERKKYMQTFDPGRVFRKLAYNNALANDRLYQACAALRPGEFKAVRTSFFPSLAATLNHILTVDWFYVDGLEGGTLGPKAWEIEEPFDTVSELAEAQAKVDGRLVDVCEGLFQHQTHHRGQVHAMLAGTSVKPPQLDEFIVADDARFRGDEIAALGWSEETLMR